MGEMAFYYAACDVAVIGGSFLPLGGQNLIEALAAGAPVVLGPSMFNFAEATRLALEAGAAVQVADAAAAMVQLKELLSDPEKRRADGDGGQGPLRGCIAAPRRNTSRCLRLLQARLTSTRSSSRRLPAAALSRRLLVMVL